MKSVMVNDKEIKFEVVKDKPMISSLEVAEHFGKLHKNFIRDIENDLAFDEFLRELKIELSEYKVPNNNKTYKSYLLDRDAFAYFVMGFTGEKAKQWKLNYIKAFNKMEELLRAKTSYIPFDPEEAKRLSQPKPEPIHLEAQIIINPYKTLQKYSFEQMPFVLRGKKRLNYALIRYNPNDLDFWNLEDSLIIVAYNKSEAYVDLYSLSRVILRKEKSLSQFLNRYYPTLLNGLITATANIEIESKSFIVDMELIELKNVITLLQNKLNDVYDDYDYEYLEPMIKTLPQIIHRHTGIVIENIPMFNNDFTMRADENDSVAKELEIKTQLLEEKEKAIKLKDEILKLKDTNLQLNNLIRTQTVALEKDIEEKDRKIEELIKSHQVLKQKYKESIKTLSRKTKEINELEAKIKSLNSDTERLNKTVSNLRRLLKSNKNDRLTNEKFYQDLLIDYMNDKISIGEVAKKYNLTTEDTRTIARFFEVRRGSKIDFEEIPVKVQKIKEIRHKTKGSNWINRVDIKEIKAQKLITLLSKYFLLGEEARRFKTLYEKINEECK